MDISFKGLNNPKIISINGQSSSGLIKMKAYRFATTLVNDEKGNHFDGFYKALDKAGNNFAWNYLPTNTPPEQMVFDVSKFELDNTDIQPSATFMLNGFELPLNNDKVLPIFSFLAKAITSVENSTTNLALKSKAQEINNIINKSILDYLG